MPKFPANDVKFEAVRKLNLPAGQYAITSSGPLGIRGLREIGDIDLVVTEELWNKLAQNYPVQSEDAVEKIRMGEFIEVLHFGSNYVDQIKGAPTPFEQIAEAEIIDGLPFVRLETILFFKENLSRPKDTADAAAIRRLMEQ